MSPKNFVTLYYTLGRNPFPGVSPYFLTRKSREISRRVVEKTLDLVKKSPRPNFNKALDFYFYTTRRTSRPLNFHKYS